MLEAIGHLPRRQLPRSQGGVVPQLRLTGSHGVVEGRLLVEGWVHADAWHHRGGAKQSLERVIVAHCKGCRRAQQLDSGVARPFPDLVLLPPSQQRHITCFMEQHKVKPCPAKLHTHLSCCSWHPAH